MIELENKIILVEITTVDANGRNSLDIFFGKVKSANKNTVVVYRPDYTEIELPYDESLYMEADEGVYELEDGSIQENPDYIARILSYENMSVFEQHGKVNT